MPNAAEADFYGLEELLDDAGDASGAPASS